MTEENVGNCKQWFKKERKTERGRNVETVALMLLYPTSVYSCCILVGVGEKEEAVCCEQQVRHHGMCAN